MRRFHYIDKNEEEQLDLIELFNFALDYKYTYDQIICILSILTKHIKIKEK